MSTPPMVCEGTDCPSKFNCRLAEKPENKRTEFTRCSLWVRREAGASACDMYRPIASDLSTFTCDSDGEITKKRGTK